jgi:hypothetical protein
MLIGFTDKTSKIIPRIFCRKFRHCAIILNNKEKRIMNKNYIMLQFIRPNKIELIRLSARDLKILESHGWVFLKEKGRRKKAEGKSTFSFFLFTSSFTCVSFAKKILGIRNPFIQTPDQLYAYFVCSV